MKKSDPETSASECDVFGPVVDFGRRSSQSNPACVAVTFAIHAMLNQQTRCLYGIPTRAVQSRFYHPPAEVARVDTPPPVNGVCTTCSCRADLNHLCWECPLDIQPTLRALGTIRRVPWPSSLQTWACPDPTPSGRAIELWRGLLLFLQDPAAPPVGERLRYYKSKATPT
ncbi:hypothetical protein HPB50_006774 [Hyalomma asiaticum]|uniref:Uncharacterized protein n=1 Tax=Hyalomma asiaticum TaxID=266040 RepID=A0ACB7S4W6_HYAAI|nr:hypothetical protein HPB50_006774 [Hyalomma asiaticum]